MIRNVYQNCISDFIVDNQEQHVDYIIIRNTIMYIGEISSVVADVSCSTYHPQCPTLLIYTIVPNIIVCYPVTVLDDFNAGVHAVY